MSRLSPSLISAPGAWRHGPAARCQSEADRCPRRTGGVQHAPARQGAASARLCRLLVWMGLGILAASVRAQEVTPYAISGYWVYARSAPGEWAEPLDAIRRLGGDTLLQFGPRVRPVPPDEQPTHPILSTLLVDGIPVVEATRRDLQALHPQNALGRVRVMSSPESYGPSLLLRPGLDRVIDAGPRRFWRLLLPAGTPGAGLEEAPLEQPRTYDLVVLAGRATYDSLAELSAEAEVRGQKVYAGIPIPPPNPKYPWDPWLEVLPVCTEVCRRVLVDYRERFGGSPAFAGVYQTLETPVQTRPLGAVLAAYRELHAVVRAELPDKRIVVSPYWDARMADGRQGTTPAAIRQGIQAIARCDVDIIAPQDSRGTGKVGLFWPSESALPVDPRLEPAVGSRSYGEAYSANSRQFFDAAAQGLDDLAAEEGRRVELWANLEAFEPGKGVPCGVFTTSQRTSKERLDRAIMFAGVRPAKLISYMWDSYYVCRGGQETTLSQDLAADALRPIVVDVRRESRGGRPGLAIHGWRLAGGTVDLRWTAAGEPQRRLAVPENLPPEGPAMPLPRELDGLWIGTDIEADRLEVRVERAGASCHHPFLLERQP